MSEHILDTVERSTEALLQQQAQLKSLCTHLKQERDALLAKNQKATKRIRGILEQLRQQAATPYRNREGGHL